MQKSVAVELTREIDEILENNIDLQTFINKYCLDYYQYGIIINNPNLKSLVCQILKEKNLYEASFILYQLNSPAEKKNTFTDFGFTSHNMADFLFEELVIPFTITGTNQKEKTAALAQMDEHLVAIEQTDTVTNYYVERYHQNLIIGIANAYNVNVAFE